MAKASCHSSAIGLCCCWFFFSFLSQGRGSTKGASTPTALADQNPSPQKSALPTQRPGNRPLLVCFNLGRLNHWQEDSLLLQHASLSGFCCCSLFSTHRDDGGWRCRASGTGVVICRSFHVWSQTQLQSK